MCEKFFHKIDVRIILWYSIRIMNKKLTLKLDEAIIDRAKQYALLHHESVSGLVERYLRAITDHPELDKVQNSNIVSELSGIISLPAHYNEKDDYRQSRIDRYND